MLIRFHLNSFNNFKQTVKINIFYLLQTIKFTHYDLDW